MNIRNSIGATPVVAVPFVLLFLLVGCSSTGTNSNTGPRFNSGSLAPGENFSYTFQDQGTAYYCRHHQPNMTGKVIVNQNAGISGQDTVTMKNIAFHPRQITIKPGTRIVWINKETDPGIDEHTVTSGAPPTNDDGY